VSSSGEQFFSSHDRESPEDWSQYNPRGQMCGVECFEDLAGAFFADLEAWNRAGPLSQNHLRWGCNLGVHERNLASDKISSCFILEYGKSKYLQKWFHRGSMGWELDFTCCTCVLVPAQRLEPRTGQWTSRQTVLTEERPDSGFYIDTHGHSSESSQYKQYAQRESDSF